MRDEVYEINALCMEVRGIISIEIETNVAFLQPHMLLRKCWLYV